MIINDLQKNLTEFGLSHDEASLFLYLLKVKSATIGEIHKSKEFQPKKRPNLYKTINSLIEKKFVTEKEKNRKKKFFPISPEIIFNQYIQEQELKVENLKKLSVDLIENMEEIFQKPNPDFNYTSTSIPQVVMQYIEDIISEKWILNESPEIGEQKGLGTIYAFEYNTGRKFGGDSAGIVIHKFRYPEHRDLAFQKTKIYQREEIEKALNQQKEQGHFYVDKYWFEDKELFLENENYSEKLVYSELTGKLNIFGKKFTGGTAILLLKEDPTIIISIWGADFRDFLELVYNFATKYRIDVKKIQDFQ